VPVRIRSTFGPKIMSCTVQEMNNPKAFSMIADTVALLSPKAKSTGTITAPNTKEM
jgi:hypothetical protein